MIDKAFNSPPVSNPAQNVITLATALDATSFALLHGNRAQQVESGNAARSLLAVMGHPSHPSRHIEFIIKARLAGTSILYTWREVGFSSISILNKALEKIESWSPFEGKPVSITVLPVPSSKGSLND